MRLARADLGELTYCSNIHPGETWAEVRANLERHLLPVRERVAPGKPFGIGLRLSAIAAEELATAEAFRSFEQFLAANQLYVFTLNGFPYGPFHGTRVKEDVYQPDWSYDERLTYTDRLADLLARLLPEGGYGTISTVPGTFKPLASDETVAQIADNLIRHAAKLALLERTTGRTIALALEPEPFCLLETIEETVRFFKRQLFSARAAERLAGLTRTSTAAAEIALRRHLGVCYDVCHAAVEYENPAASLGALRRAGIGIAKLQLSAALRIEAVDEATVARLRPFDDGVYLHQTIASRGGELTRHLDLQDAFAAVDEERGAEWRVHFHVPIFLERMEHFGTTQSFLAEILDLHAKEPISPHLEVETYTWDVLPPEYRASEVSEAVARELAWVLNRLAT
ncbi:MAG TPA: metabolite traffic protein EboE [Geminicoccaceae bacterium]